MNGPLGKEEIGKRYEIYLTIIHFGHDKWSNRHKRIFESNHPKKSERGYIIFQ